MKVVCLFHRGFKLFPRGFKQLEALAAEGNDVQVLCTDRGELPKSENHEGALIQRMRVPWPDRPVLKPFAIAYVILLLLKAGLRHRDADVVHCFGLYAFLPGFVVSRLSGAALSYDAFEDYAYEVDQSGALGRISEWVDDFIVSLEQFLVARCDRIYTVPSVDDRLETRFGQVTDRVTTLQNVPRRSEGDLPPPDSCDLYEPEATTLVYVGGLTEDKGSIHMANVLATAAERTDRRIQAFIIGSFHDDSRSRVESVLECAGIDNRVQLLGFVPYDEVMPYLSASDVALHLYQDTPWNRRSTGSSKLYRYMAGHLPILVSDLPGIGGVVDDYDCGIVVSPTDVDAAADAIVSLVEDDNYREQLGDRASDAFTSELNWGTERETFVSAFPERA